MNLGNVPPRFPIFSPKVSSRSSGKVWRAANDNAHGASNDVVIRTALRHFAEHGLSAAEQARSNAETAFFKGDRDGYDWWLEICRTLDKRMAAAIAARQQQVLKRLPDPEN